MKTDSMVPIVLIQMKLLAKQKENHKLRELINGCWGMEGWRGRMRGKGWLGSSGRTAM